MNNYLLGLDQDNKGNTFIYVQLIEEIPKSMPDDKTIYNYIQLFDNHGNFAINNETSIKSFTSPVFKGNKVKWKNATSNRKNRIKFLQINLKIVGDSKDLLKGQYTSSDGAEIVGEVKGSNLLSGDTETYSIKIEVNEKTYTIDPVLEYHDNN